MNANISYANFVNILANKLRNMFTCQNYCNDYVHYNVYTYNRHMDKLINNIGLNFGNLVITNIHLLEAWLRFCCDIKQPYNIDPHIRKIYETISLVDLDLYIRITSYLSGYFKAEHIGVVKVLIKIFKELSNLDLSKFMDAHYSFFYELMLFNFESWEDEFRNRVKKLNNDKISEL